ncbi:MAG: HAMP domain-containing sensor histidine kinase [Candidatus Cloacimonetes bacterium]|nr:HAMP domain-containing sensor histidine kinase [Candidatus Cloacimonadota bacterium]
MKLVYKLNLRVIVIITFVVLYQGSLILLNSFFLDQQNKMNSILSVSHFDEKFSELSFASKQDSLKATEIMKDFREAIASSSMLRRETQIYSALVLFLLMLFSIFVFIIIFYRITAPLKELNQATLQIRNGDFSVNLSESGIPEMRQLKQSFNRMSKELDFIQKKLLAAEKEMIWKELSRVLAHEIKNPLTPIQLSVQRLEDKYDSDPEKFRAIFPESASIIHQEIANLRELVKSFSVFAKQKQPDESIFNPAEYLTEIVKPYQHKYQIICELNDCMIKFDQNHFYQIVTNVLQNAIDASGVDNPIIIKLFPSKSFVVLQIIDEGAGISQEDLMKIFEPYFSTKKHGTGLGLALVKNLVELNKGYIRVHSRIGEGSTFEIIMDASDNIE